MIIICFVIFLSITVFAQSNSSKLLYFHYGSWGDTAFASLTIKVKTLDSLNNDTTVLNEVLITITDKDGPKIINDTINNGIKTFGFNYGMFSILISKKGYQSILLKNYKSIPDQFSRAEVLLVRGSGIVPVDTNPDPDPFPKSGTDTTFYTNKQIACITTYNNYLIIYQLCFYENGTLGSEKHTFHDTLASKIEYYPNGTIEFIGMWNQDLTIGFRNDYYPNGKLKSELLNTKEGQLHWTAIDSLGNYEIKNGNSVKSYYRKRHIKQKYNYEHFKNGKENGEKIMYYDNGTILSKSVYKKGVVTLYKFYGRDGKLFSKSKYRKGKVYEKDY